MPFEVPLPRTSRFGSPLVLSRVHWARPELVAEVKFLSWTDDNPEIDASGREAVRLDLSSLLSSFGSFTVNADSATAGELLGIFAGNAAGTALGAKLADATSAGGNVTITPTGSYLFFVADNATTSGADVLLHTLTVTPNAVPEPPSLALLCAALLGAGLLRKRGSCAGQA